MSQQLIKSEYEPSYVFRDMPSYNPEFVEDRLRQSIRQQTLLRSKEIPEQASDLKQKKYAAYYRVQSWLQEIGDDLNMHRLIIKDLYRELEKRTIISHHAVTKIIEFLQNFIRHEKDNVKYLTQKNVDLMKLFTHQENQIYPKLYQTTQEIDKYDKGNALAVLTTLEGIEMFIKEKLELNMQMFESATKNYKELYDRAFSSYASSYAKVNKYRRKYQKMFASMMSQDLQGKDLYHVERKLINAFIESTKLQQSMGLAVIKLWDEIIKQESIRYEIVQKSLRMYIDKHVSLSSSKSTQKLTSQEEIIYAYLNEMSPEVECKESLSFKNMISMDNQAQLTRMIGKALDNNSVQEFLYNYPDIYLKVASERDHSLIIQQFENTRVDCGKLMKEWKDCILLITIDNHLLVQLYDESIVAKFYLKKCELQARSRNPLIAEIVSVKSGLIFNTEQSRLFQMDSDQFDQLYGIIYKIIKA